MHHSFVPSVISLWNKLPDYVKIGQWCITFRHTTIYITYMYCDVQINCRRYLQERLCLPMFIIYNA